MTKELLLTSARDASLALRVGAQQVRVEFTAKQLKRAEQRIRFVMSYQCALLPRRPPPLTHSNLGLG